MKKALLKIEKISVEDSTTEKKWVYLGCLYECKTEKDFQTQKDTQTIKRGTK